MIFIAAYRHWKLILGALAMLAGIFTVIFTFYSWGYNSCKKDWDAAITARNNIQIAQVKAITNLSESVVTTATILTKQSNANLDKILATVNKKPMFKIVDGKCDPSNEFEQAYKGILQESIK